MKSDKNSLHKCLFLFLFILIPFLSSAQKIEMDTSFFQGTQMVQPGENFSLLEVCERDKKGRKVGLCTKYNRQLNPVEMTNYSKDELNGPYKRLSSRGHTLIEGQYVKGKKDGNWISYDVEGNPSAFEIYENGEEILARTIEMISQSTGNEAIFMVVEQQPKFPGGPQGWMEFLGSNLVYPKEAKDKRIEGPVNLRFLVTKEGYILNPEVISSPSHLLSREALRVIKLSPKWIPRKVGDQEVDGYMQFNINFRLN